MLFVVVAQFIRRLIPGLIGSAVLVLASLVVAGDPETDIEHSFRMVISGKLTIEAQGKRQAMESNAELNYTWARRGQERILTFDSIRVKMKEEGKDWFMAHLSAKRFLRTENGVTEEKPIEKVPEPLRQSLLESFDVPIIKIEVDQNGKETKRSFLGGANANLITDQVANTQFFHPPFFLDRDEWQADTEVSVGKGQFAKGTLTYLKGAKTNGKWTCKVKGTLTNESKPKENFTARTTFVIKGEQVYDLAQREWCSGRHDLDFSMTITGDGETATGKGAIVLTLEDVSKKKNDK